MARLTLPRVRDIGAPPRGKRKRITDDGCPGLVLRVTSDGAKSWWMRSQVDGRRTEVKIGDYPLMLLADARAAVEERRTAPRGEQGRATMRDLWRRYASDHLPKKAASSAAKDGANWKLHVEKPLGSMLVAAVTRDDVARLHAAISKTSPGAANRVLSLLSKAFALAERWGMRNGANPARGHDRNPERKVERYLTAEEYGRLVAALEDEGDVVRDAIALAMHTGARIGEVLARTTADVDAPRQRLRMGTTKTGPDWLTCSPVAWGIVERRGKVAAKASDDRLFPVSYDVLERRWRLIRERAKLPGLRIHDLRHAFASVGAAAGMSLPQIGALLRHKSPATTARYAHLAADQQRAHAALIGERIRAATATRESRRPTRRQRSLP